MKELNTVSDLDVELFIVLKRNYSDEMKYLLSADKFPFPVIFDNEDVINRINHFPKKENYRTFLLNGENQVVAIGNPVNNPKILSLFKEYIASANDEVEDIISEDFAAIGTVFCNDSIELQIPIVIRENSPLNIRGISTSCDCLKARISSDKLYPDRMENITISYAADTQAGPFIKYIDIYFEEKDDPLRIKIYGYKIKITN